MADGSRVDPGDDDAERTALAEEARLIHRTRWRLVAWSGISTLVVLVVLGAALYAAVAGTLAGASVDQLSARVDPWVARLEGERAGRDGDPGFGFQPGQGNTLPVRVRRRRAAGPAGARACRRAGRPARARRASPRPAPRRTAVTSDAVDLEIGSGIVPVRLLTQRVVYADDGQHVLPAGAPGSLDRGRDPQRAADGPARRRAGGGRRRGGVRHRLRAAGPGPDPRLARRRSGRPSGASASSPRTRATSCGPRSPSSARRWSTCRATVTGRWASRPRRSTTSTPRSRTWRCWWTTCCSSPDPIRARCRSSGCSSTWATSRPTRPRRMARTAEERGVRVVVDPEPAMPGGRPGAAPAARHDPRGQRDPAQPARWRRDGPGACRRVHGIARGCRPGPRAAPRATWPTSSTGSTGPRERRRAAPAWASRSRAGSWSAMAAGSVSATARRAGPCSARSCRRVGEGRARDAQQGSAGRTVGGLTPGVGVGVPDAARGLAASRHGP